MTPPAGVSRRRRRGGALAPQPSALFSTLTSSAASFTAGGAGVTLTFTAKDQNDVGVVGYTPVPESGVV